MTGCCMRTGHEGDLRLIEDEPGDPDVAAGILEIFHAGAWGTVCNSNPTFLDPALDDYLDYLVGGRTDPITTVCPSMSSRHHLHT